MALGKVRRWSWVPVVAGIGLLQGCFTTGDDDDSSGCSKDSDCRDGRICENKTCVTDPTGGAVLGGSSGSMNGNGGTSTTGKGGSGNAPTSGGSSGTGSSKGGSGGTGGGTAGAPSNGGSTSGSAGMGGGTAATGGFSGTSNGPCSENDPAQCPTTDSMTYCLDGAVVTETCDAFCTGFGFPPLTCTAPAGCDCDVNNPTDETCEIATNVVCNCFEGTATPCVTTVDPNNPDSIYFYPPFIYSSCYAGSPEDQEFFHCLYDQAMIEPAPTCADGFAACGVDTGGAGAPAQ